MTNAHTPLVAPFPCCPFLLLVPAPASATSLRGQRPPRHGCSGPASPALQPRARGWGWCGLRLGGPCPGHGIAHSLQRPQVQAGAPLLPATEPPSLKPAAPAQPDPRRALNPCLSTPCSDRGPCGHLPVPSGPLERAGDARGEADQGGAVPRGPGRPQLLPHRRLLRTILAALRFLPITPAVLLYHDLRPDDLTRSPSTST